MKNNEPVEVKFELPFPMSEYQDRLRRLREGMSNAGIEVKIVTNPIDFYWLTGTRMRSDAENPGWVIVPLDGEPIGVVRHLECSTHKMSSTLNRWYEFPDEGPVVPYDPVGCTVKALKDNKLDRKTIGMNYRVVSLNDFNRFKKLLPNMKIRDFRAEQIRIQKSKAEIEAQAKANKANQDALKDAIEEMQIGWTERQLYDCIVRNHEKHLGKDYEASLGMVMVGKKRVLQMHSVVWPGERTNKVEKNDIIYLEPGTTVKRYTGSMIRCVFMGDPPQIVRKTVDTAIEALNKAIDATAPGKTAHEVDKAARDHFKEMGVECQGRIGYSIGLGAFPRHNWSEGWVMSIMPNNLQVMKPGHIFHYISLGYCPGWGYMGASEQVLVTEKGHEVLGDRQRTCERQLFVK